MAKFKNVQVAVMSLMAGVSANGFYDELKALGTTIDRKSYLVGYWFATAMAQGEHGETEFMDFCSTLGAQVAKNGVEGIKRPDGTIGKTYDESMAATMEVAKAAGFDVEALIKGDKAAALATFVAAHPGSGDSLLKPASKASHESRNFEGGGFKPPGFA